MKNNKSKLQKLAILFAIASFISAIACVAYLFIKIDDLGWENPISASLLASTFFFVFVGIILVVIGTANIPNFKFDDPSKRGELE